MQIEPGYIVRHECNALTKSIEICLRSDINTDLRCLFNFKTQIYKTSEDLTINELSVIVRLIHKNYKVESGYIAKNMLMHLIIDNSVIDKNILATK